MVSQAAAQQIQIWPIDRLVFFARNPRKNDAAVDRMCGSIREFGFKIPVLAGSDGEVVDGHLRLKAARKLGITEGPPKRTSRGEPKDRSGATESLDRWEPGLRRRKKKHLAQRRSGELK